MVFEFKPSEKGSSILRNSFILYFTSSTSYSYFTDADFIQWTFPKMKCVFFLWGWGELIATIVRSIESQSGLKYLKIMCKLNSTSGKTKSNPFYCWHGSFSSHSHCIRFGFIFCNVENGFEIDSIKYTTKRCENFAFSPEMSVFHWNGLTGLSSKGYPTKLKTIFELVL